MRDLAAEGYRAETGDTWRPRNGSHGSQTGKLTSAAIDARDYLRARKNRETTAHLPEGTLVAFTGGKDFDDVTAIWRRKGAALPSRSQFRLHTTWWTPCFSAQLAAIFSAPGPPPCSRSISSYLILMLSSEPALPVRAVGQRHPGNRYSLDASGGLLRARAREYRGGTP